ncbi:Nn.00g007710.m01.CDS01 [Neocucurbitaria sp. VM-36]
MQGRHTQTDDEDILRYTSEQRFAAAYTACNPLSCYHDLTCGHRIEVAYETEYCGINCLRPMGGQPFVCPDCLTADVRQEISLEGLDLISTGEDVDMGGYTSSGEDKIQKIADMKLKGLLEQGRRLCKVSARFADPKLQFFHKFLLEEGYEGIEEEKDTVLSPMTRYKRPAGTEGRFKKSSVWKHREPTQVNVDEDARVTVTLADVMDDWKNVSQQNQLPKGGRRQGPAGTDHAMDDLLEHFQSYST